VDIVTHKLKIVEHKITLEDRKMQHKQNEIVLKVKRIAAQRN
ncbi:7897_t:CDS:1, partial [Funneliformis geosporum]